jgi:hypothetical protein
MWHPEPGTQNPEPNKKPALTERTGFEWEWLATAYSPTISRWQYHRRYGA